MRTVKVEQRREHGLARNRLAAGRAAGLQGRAQADPTIYYSSCTNRLKPWSGTPRLLTASGTFAGFFSLVTGIPLPPFPNKFHEGRFTFLGQTVCFVRVWAQFLIRAGLGIFW